MVEAAEPDGVTVCGKKPHDAPDGSPEQLKVTAELKPFAGVTEIEVVPFWPPVTVCDVGVAATEKSITTWLTAFDELTPKLESPLYVAVTESEPGGSAEVAKTAELPLRGAVPKLVPPLLKVTMPVAVPLNCPEMFAVKVTDCVLTEGLGDEVKVVEEVAFPTVWPTDVEVLPAKSASPS